jgi:hypothetical protein
MLMGRIGGGVTSRSVGGAFGQRARRRRINLLSTIPPQQLVYISFPVGLFEANFKEGEDTDGS